MSKDDFILMRRKDNRAVAGSYSKFSTFFNESGKTVVQARVTKNDLQGKYKFAFAAGSVWDARLLALDHPVTLRFFLQPIVFTTAWITSVTSRLNLPAAVRASFMMAPSRDHRVNTPYTDDLFAATLEPAAQKLHRHTAIRETPIKILKIIPISHLASSLAPRP